MWGDLYGTAQWSLSKRLPKVYVVKGHGFRKRMLHPHTPKKWANNWKQPGNKYTVVKAARHLILIVTCVFWPLKSSYKTGKELTYVEWQDCIMSSSPRNAQRSLLFSGIWWRVQEITFINSTYRADAVVNLSTCYSFRKVLQSTSKTQSHSHSDTVDDSCRSSPILSSMSWKVL